MCRLRRHLHSEQGIVWIDPTARKEPSLDYRHVSAWKEALRAQARCSVRAK